MTNTKKYPACDVWAMPYGLNLCDFPCESYGLPR